MQNRSADPDTAYRFASGLPVVHPYHRARVQIGTPLDFLAVMDHAEFMGVMPKIFQGDPLVTGTSTGARFQEMAAEEGDRDLWRADRPDQPSGAAESRSGLRRDHPDGVGRDHGRGRPV